MQDGDILKCKNRNTQRLYCLQFANRIIDTVAERLRRLTRNQLGLSRVGSSPASVDIYFLVQNTFTIDHKTTYIYLHSSSTYFISGSFLFTCSYILTTGHIHTYTCIYTAAYTTLILKILTFTTSFQLNEHIYNL
jgi:hypothetical protein